MKKNSIKKSLKQFDGQQLSQDQNKMVKGGCGDGTDGTDDIVVIDIISI